MRVLLCTVGTRGDVQPLVALAMELRALGQDVRMCVPPDFGDWLGRLGISVVSMGSEVRRPGPDSSQDTPDSLSPKQIVQYFESLIPPQFATIPAAAQDCDVIMGNAALLAGGTVAEQLGILYVYMSYCPAALSSPHHPPLPIGDGAPAPETGDNRSLWVSEAECWNQVIREPLNSYRASLGLAPVVDVMSHIFTDRPWLAADPTLAPWPGPADLDVVQTSAWILPDRRPLPAELETFLRAGEPPVYFGFGSMPVPRDIGPVLIKAAREFGHRAIVHTGWADLAAVDGEPDCLFIGEVNHQALFSRVTAVVHHGGWGTTTAAARAGAPQVVIPQVWDQHYWAQRVRLLGIGAAHPPGVPTAGSLAAALGQALRPGVADRARAVAAMVRTDGARVAAQRLIAQIQDGS